MKTLFISLLAILFVCVNLTAQAITYRCPKAGEIKTRVVYQAPSTGQCWVQHHWQGAAVSDKGTEVSMSGLNPVKQPKDFYLVAIHKNKLICMHTTNDTCDTGEMQHDYGMVTVDTEKLGKNGRFSHPGWQCQGDVENCVVTCD